MEQTREEYLLEKLANRSQYSAEEAQGFESEYQELLAAKQRAEAIEDKVHGEGIPFEVSGVELDGVPVEIITLIEQVVKADRRRMLNEHAVELEQLENDFAAYKDEATQKIVELSREIDELEADYERCNQELREKRDDNLRLIGERDEANKGRDNAAAQLAEAQKEIKRLESQIDDYQKAQIHGEREAQKIIDVTPDETNSIAAAVEAVRKLVNPSTEEKAAFALDAFVKRNPELIAPELQVSPFRGSEPTGDQLSDDDTEASSDKVQPEVDKSAVPEVPFLNNATEESSDLGSVAGSDVQGVAELTKRVAELEKAVFGQVSESAA